MHGAGGNDLIFGDGYSGTSASTASATASTGYIAAGGAGGLGGGGAGGNWVSAGTSTISAAVPNSDPNLAVSWGGGGTGGLVGKTDIKTGGSATVGDVSPGFSGAVPTGSTNYAAVGGGGGGVRNGGLNDNAVVVEDTTGTVGAWEFKNGTGAGNTSISIGNVYTNLQSAMKNNLNFTSQTSGAGNDTLYGDAGNDWIAGGNGNDAIYGGRGNDVMWGVGGTASGTNNDTFYWQRGDAGTGASDEIRDFTPWASGAGMKIDLSGLLENFSVANIANLSQWISISTVTAGSTAATTLNTNLNSLFTESLATNLAVTTMTIDVDGAGSGTTTQTIYFRNWTPSTTLGTNAKTWYDNGVLVV